MNGSFGLTADVHRIAATLKLIDYRPNVSSVDKANPWLGLVIGTALATNTLLAVSIGGRTAASKNAGSGPGGRLRAFADDNHRYGGIFLVLSLASMMMPLLV